MVIKGDASLGIILASIHNKPHGWEMHTKLR